MMFPPVQLTGYTILIFESIFLGSRTSYYADPVITELSRMSGDSPLNPQMEPILVAGEWLYSQLLVLLELCPMPNEACVVGLRLERGSVRGFVVLTLAILLFWFWLDRFRDRGYWMG
jgi:hypothetical protein